MQPDETKSSQGGGVQVPSTQPTPLGPDQTAAQREAATNVIRSSIDHLYDKSAEIVEHPVAQPQIESTSPYARTHGTTPPPQAEQWKQYHSAWQNYYQKYYESYYTHHVEQAKKQITETPTHRYFADQPAVQKEETNEELTQDEALFDLRQKLLGKVQQSAKKVRKSRHFIPILAALVVVLVFVFLQYNRVFFSAVAAYVSPGAIDPQNIVVDPNNDVAVGPEPLLIIPKINVNVPVMYDVGADYDSQMKAMETGVAHFAIPGASSHPGEIGNTAIAGHSSNDLFDTGDYKFIFAQLEKLAPGDSIYANYNSKRYTYVVTKVEVVKPTDISKLVYPTTKPILTLITCTPLGTATNRLLVTAEQVSPDPEAAAAAPVVDINASTASLPGNSPTLFERLFGGGN